MTTHASTEHGGAIEAGPELARHLAVREPMTFRHELAADPRLNQSAIASLADALGAGSVVRENADRPLVFADGAPEPEHEAQGGAAISALEQNNSWLTLLNIERQPAYRRLIDEQLEALAGRCGLPADAWRRRMGFVFASSPGSVTGAHFDIEHSLLLQLRGNRVLSFGAFADDATLDHEVRRYWNGSYGKLATMPRQTDEVRVGPGTGVYIPPYRPHWLHNGDTASLSLTITFFTRDNDDESLVHAFNERARKLGLHPRRIGSAPRRDRAKAAAMRAYRAARERRQ
jgi:hypothetical protein